MCLSLALARHRWVNLNTGHKYSNVPLVVGCSIGLCPVTAAGRDMGQTKNWRVNVDTRLRAHSRVHAEYFQLTG